MSLSIYMHIGGGNLGVNKNFSQGWYLGFFSQFSKPEVLEWLSGVFHVFE